MARLKRKTSRKVRNAAARAAGLESIDPELDLGNGLTMADYRAAIVDARTNQSTYNTQLSYTDEAKLRFDASEAAVAELSARMLAAVSAKFGRESIEYAQAGGKRTSERKGSAPKVPVAIPEAA